MNTRANALADGVLPESFQHFFDDAPIMMGICQVEGDQIRHLGGNKATQEYLRSTRQAIQGKLASELGAMRASVDLWLHHYREAERTGTPQVFDYENPFFRGGSHFQATAIFIGKSAEGHPRFRYIVNDVTELKVAYQKLKESQEREFSATFEQAAIGLAHVALDGTFLRVNKKFGEITGYSAQELSRVSFKTITHPDDIDLDWQQAMQLLRGEIETYSMEKRYLHRSGKVVWVSLTGSLLRNEDGSSRYFIAAVQDISETVASRQKLETLAKELQKTTDELQAIIDGAPSKIVFVKDLEGRFITVNRRMEELTGISRHQIRGQTDHELAPADCAEIYRANDQRVLASGLPEQFEEPARAPDGTELIFLSTKFPLLDPKGKPYAICCIAADITQRKLMEEKLRKSEATLAAILDAATESVWLFDPAGKLLLGNALAFRRIGLPPEALVGKHFKDLIPPHLAESRQKRIDEVVATGKSVEFEDSRAGIDFVHVFSPIHDPNGRVLGVVAFSRDVTEKKQAEEERERLLQQAQDALRVRDEFISIASHELKTPLTALKLQQQLLQRTLNQPSSTYSAEKIQRFASDSNRQVDRLNHLLEDLMDVSRIRTGKLGFQFGVLDVSQLVEEVSRRIGPQLAEAGCQVELQLAGDLSARWDRLRIEQIVWNYIANAAKYAPGSKITVRTLRVGMTGRIEVRDRGPGIAPENLELIFERFERGSARAGTTGLGLGLFIVKTIAEGHGGKAWVESQLNEGSTFIVELPLAPPAAMEFGCLPPIETLAHE